MEPLFWRAVLEKYYVQTYYVHYVHTGATYSSNNLVHQLLYYSG